MLLGIIGGLGPAATICFMDMITRMTDAKCDQEHLEMLVHSVPSVPDRTKYILGKSSDSPVPKMIQVGNALEKQGADIIAIPCMTAHCFHDELQKHIGVTVLNGIKLTAEALHNAGVKKAGIMATDGTVQSGLFQKELEKFGISTVPLSSIGQKKVMSIIYDDIKTNSVPDMVKFDAVKEELFGNGAECIILGCTELSLIKRDYDIGNGFADAMEILAGKSVLECGKKLRYEYEKLIVLQ